MSLFQPHVHVDWHSMGCKATFQAIFWTILPLIAFARARKALRASDARREAVGSLLFASEQAPISNRPTSER